MTDNILGKNIAKFREEMGLSQSDLGRRLGVSPQAVSRWEHGGMPDALLLPKVAATLGCSLDDLYALSNSPSKSVEEMLIQELQHTSPEQCRKRSIQLAWHLMKINGALSDDSVNSLFDIASYCENDDETPTFGSGRAFTDCHFAFQDGLMQASIIPSFKYVLMMQEPEEGYASIMKNAEDYRAFFSLLGKEYRLPVFLLGLSLPYERQFTRDYVCEQLLISEQLAQEILDEFCAYLLLKRVSIQEADRCIDTYSFHKILPLVPFLYFAGTLIRDGSACCLSAHMRDTPLLKMPLATTGGVHLRRTGDSKKQHRTFFDVSSENPKK